MDRTRNDGRHYFFKNVVQKLSGLSSSISKTAADSSELKLKIKQSRGLVLIFCSLIFAFISISLTEETAVRKYRISEWPVQAVWQLSLKQMQFISRANVGEFSSLLQNHREAFHSEKSIWISEDACVVYLPQSPYTQSAELWTCPGTTHRDQVKKWLKLGSGLEAFEKLVESVQKQPKKPQAIVQKRSNNIDPKEIRY